MPHRTADARRGANPGRAGPRSVGRAHLVAIKSEAQQAILTLHRMRAQLLKFRVMQTNALRGFLYEFGVVLPQGHRALAKAWPTALAELAEQLPVMLLESLQ